MGPEKNAASALDGAEILSSTSNPITSANFTGGMWGTTSGEYDDIMYMPAGTYSSTSHQHGTIVMTGDSTYGTIAFDGGRAFKTNGYDLTVYQIQINGDNCDTVSPCLQVDAGSDITFTSSAGGFDQAYGSDGHDVLMEYLIIAIVLQNY